MTWANTRAATVKAWVIATWQTEDATGPPVFGKIVTDRTDLPEVTAAYPCSIQTLYTDALFASALQRIDDLSPRKVRQAIAMALDEFGATGCAGRIAQEFGDHPETAALRMRWARATLADLDGQSVPRIRRIAADDSSALGKNPTAGLSAIKAA